jgi:hypothetical protein
MAQSAHARQAPATNEQPRSEVGAEP